MLHFVYVLYSATLKSYYIGETSDLGIRLKWHNEKEFTKAYTTKADDWFLYYQINCVDIIQARKIEKHIKSMKSRTYLQNLKKYIEISEKLLERHS